MNNPLTLKDIQEIADKRNESARFQRKPGIGTKVWLVKE